MSPKQAVELFHLYFCRQLDQNLEKDLYAIKGGCNLRFFHKSIRYSEDIDIDIQTVAAKTLENKVDRILKGQPFLQSLILQKIELVSFTKPKQTDTVQRWKIQIKSEGVTLPTKIEFSRRGLDENVEYGPVDASLQTAYKTYPILCSHYDVTTAIEQKIKALIYRTETQARDIFDLDLLLKNKSLTKLKFTEEEKKKAIENTMSVSFTDFQGQVVAYLMTEYQEYYSNEKVWSDLQESVLKYLESYEAS